MESRIGFVLILCFCYFFPVYCEEEYLHVFAIPQTATAGSDNPPHVWITTSSANSIDASLFLPGFGYQFNAIVTRDDPAEITLPELPPYSFRVGSSGKSNKTIIVRSAKPVTVYVIENTNCCGDAFLVLPAQHLGQEYYVASYVPYSRAFPSFFVITALEHDTSISFVYDGQASNVILRRYETYRFSSDNDLTGTHIQSTKPVSISSGIFSRVPEGIESFDGMLVNLLPVEQWGRKFVLAPYLTKSCGYVYRVLSTIEPTILAVTSTGTVLNVELEGGEFYEGNVNGDTMLTITSDNPVLVVKYMKGKHACDNRGDPTMIIVPPIESAYTQATFPVMETFYTWSGDKEYLINVIINCSYTDGLVLDTTSISGWNQLSTADGSICVVRGQVSPGLRHVTHTNPLATFTVSVYMLESWNDEAYSFQAGFISSVEAPPTTQIPSTTMTTDSPPFTTMTDSPVITIDGLNLYCEGTYMYAIFNKSVLSFEIARDVRLVDRDCMASPYGNNLAMISTDYHKCNTYMEESGSHIIFRNTLVLNSYDLDMPNKMEVEIECRVDRRPLVDNNVPISIAKHVSFGTFSFELQVFNDNTYSAPYRPADYPIGVKYGDSLYFAARVSTVNELDISVDSCWSTNTDDPWADYRVAAIDDGCPDHESVTLIESDKSTIRRFSVNTAQFHDKRDIQLYLHCHLIACDATSATSTCNSNNNSNNNCDEQLAPADLPSGTDQKNPPISVGPLTIHS